MSTKEVCAILNISHDTLRRMRERGDITPEPGNPLLRKQPFVYQVEEVTRLQENPPKARAQV